VLSPSQNDTSEVDIEAVTEGSSLVNGTINYTTHPSRHPNGTSIADATRSTPFANTNLSTFHEHRFDCEKDGAASFYLDGRLMQRDAHNTPRSGGNVQLKLWADGNSKFGNPKDPQLLEKAEPSPSKTLRS
jgi:hypothetical protein